nr:4Fe-4S binding protein [Prevotella sp.]
MFWILIVFLIVGIFYPIIGFAAIICMLGPVIMSSFRGRYWCGHYCPRGSFYDHVISKVTRGRKIPSFLRHPLFRVFMILFIFAMFGVQLYFAWGDWNAMGKVFWNIILLTTIVGIILGIAYSPRTWCSFCPMGTLSKYVAPRKNKSGFRKIIVNSSCISCKKCSKVCPMQLKPFEAKGKDDGYLHPDCIKCEKCVDICPRKSIKMK